MIYIRVYSPSNLQNVRRLEVLVGQTAVERFVFETYFIDLTVNFSKKGEAIDNRKTQIK